MKYAPLVWAALWRKPAEAALTWLAIIAAFTLFGLMNGLTTAVHRIIDNAGTDLLYVEQKFFGSLPIGLREQILRVDGVTAVGAVLGLGAAPPRSAPRASRSSRRFAADSALSYRLCADRYCR